MGKLFGKGGKLDNAFRKLDNAADAVGRRLDTEVGKALGAKPSSLASGDDTKRHDAVDKIFGGKGATGTPQATSQPATSAPQETVQQQDDAHERSDAQPQKQPQTDQSDGMGGDAPRTQPPSPRDSKIGDNEDFTKPTQTVATAQERNDDTKVTQAEAPALVATAPPADDSEMIQQRVDEYMALPPHNRTAEARNNMRTGLTPDQLKLLTTALIAKATQMHPVTPQTPLEHNDITTELGGTNTDHHGDVPE